MHEAFRHRALGALSQFVSRRAWLIIVGALLLAGGSIYYTSQKLTFDANRDNLISHDIPWFKKYLAWNKMFGQQADVIVVDTYNRQGKPDAAAAKQARYIVQKLGQQLKKDPHVAKIVWGFPTSAASPKLLRLLSERQMKFRLRQMTQAKGLLASESPQDFVQKVTRALRSQGSSKDQSPSSNGINSGIQSFTALINAFTKRLNTPADVKVNFMKLVEADQAANSWHYLTSPNQRLLLLPVVLNKAGNNSMNPFAPSVAYVRSVLHNYRLMYPRVSMGFTGSGALAVDETASATHASDIASILATILIAALLMLSFQSIRKPLLILTALLIAIAWTFGFATLAVGHLQVISVVFTIMLLSLGAAYGIYILSRFELVRHDYPDNAVGFARTLRNSLETVGPGLFTGAAAAAAAFCTTMLTDFTGVAEMGLIAGVGVLLCLLSMMTVFPALLRVFRSGHKHTVPMAERKVRFFRQGWIMPVSRRPVVTLVVCGVIVVVSLAAMTQMRYNYDLMAMMPPKAPSVIWQQNLVSQGDMSIYTASSVAYSLKEAKEQTEKFRQLDTVESVGGIARLFPRNEQAKIKLIQKTKKELEPQLASALLNKDDTNTLPGKDDSKGKKNLVKQLVSLKMTLGLFSSLAPKSMQSELEKVDSALGRFVVAAHQLKPQVLNRRLAALERDYSTWRHSAAKLISESLDTSPITIADFPPGVLSSFIADTKEGKIYSLNITPRVPANVSDPLSPKFLGRFVKSLQSVNPEVTGGIVQIYNSGQLIWSSYIKAGIYAFIAVFFLLWFDFRSIAHTLLTLLPVAIGFTVCFAIMWLIGQQINAANIIVLPLMFGIGVDVGVQVTHRYRADPVTRPLGLTAGTGKGMSLTSYTAIIGFGSLLIAHHRGIKSLGLVLAVGVAMTLLACWTVMPACFELISRRHSVKENIE